MSKLKIFTVYDSKAEAYMQPFFCQSTGVAVRMFEQAANDPNHSFCKWPGDYTLFELGEWDEHSAMFTPAVTPTNLGMAITMQRSHAGEPVKLAEVL